MKKIVFTLLALLLVCSNSYSSSKESDEDLILMGKCGFISSQAIKVKLDATHTITGLFQKDMESVTITIKKQNGEIVSIQTMDAKEFDEFQVQIENYKKGDYIIEISSPEGVLEGRF